MNVVRSLPSARIYLTIDAPGGNSPQLMLSAYKVDGGQPLVINLLATGTYASLDRLEAEGIVDDLATMVESAHAIPVDTNNVVPWLRTATPTPALEVSTPVATLEPPRVATPTIALLATDHPEADGWTRYTAPSTGLSFAYPSGWRLAAPSGQLSPGAMLPYQLIAPFNDFPGGNKVEIIYLSYEIRPEQSLADWVAVYERAEGTPPETASTQAGIIAEPDGREHDYLQQVVKDVWGTSQNFFLRQGRLVILLQASTTEQYAEGMAAALESILGTFRFAPSAATTLNELYGTNRQWPTLDDYLRMVQPAETPASRCDVVCQDATASAALALTPVTTVTQSPSFRATEEVYNQRLSATQTRQAQIIPTPTPTPRTTPTPRPAGPGLAIYDGASTYNPLPKFQLVYTTNEWKQSEEGLDHQAIAGCSLALHPPARGMVGPTTQRQAYFGGYTWDAKIWVQEGVIGYTLNTDNRYFLLELRWPKDGEQSVRNQCEQAGEKVLDTFRMVG